MTLPWSLGISNSMGNAQNNLTNQTGNHVSKSIFYFRSVPASVHRIVGWHQEVAEVFANGADLKNYVDPDVTRIFRFLDSENLAGHKVEDKNAISYFQSGMGQVMNVSDKTS
jgi:hypothetical protein